MMFRATSVLAMLLWAETAQADLAYWSFIASRDGSGGCTIEMHCSDYQDNGPCENIGLGGMDECRVGTEPPICPIQPSPGWHDVHGECYEAYPGWIRCDWSGKSDIDLPCEQLDFPYLGITDERCGPLDNPFARPCGRNEICPEEFWVDCPDPESPDEPSDESSAEPMDELHAAGGCGCRMSDTGHAEKAFAFALLAVFLVSLVASRRHGG
jgi:MYXO-CTERM domain-containing protein